MIESTPIKRHDIGGLRYYTPATKEEIPWEEQQLAPSVTTVLQVLSKGPILTKWAINKFPTHDQYKEYLNYVSFLGTTTHVFIDDLVKGNTVRLDGTLMDDRGELIDIGRPKYQKPLQGFLVAFLKFWSDMQKRNIKPLASELSLWTPEFAGALDLLAEISYKNKPKTCLFDWKTRIGVPMQGDHPGWRGHAAQLTGYKELCLAYKDEIPTPDLLYNVYLGEGGGYKLKPREFVPEYFDCALRLWQIEHPDKPKEPKILPVEFSLNEINEIKNDNCKLTENQVTAIFYDDRRHCDIARTYKVTQANILRIKKGRSWKHLQLLEEDNA